MNITMRNFESTAVTPPAGPPRVRAGHGRLSRLVTAGVLLSAVVPCSLPAQSAPVCPTTSPAFKPVGEITSKDGKLQAVIKTVNGKRNVPDPPDPPNPPSTTPSMLRYFEGYNPADSSQKWPTDPSAPGPGPTLRAEIGDVVNITLLNQVKVEDFPGTLDSGEEGRNNGCDQAANATTGVRNWYPANDKYPNCFHGSSSTNLHFHGTHVSPSTTADNVLINVRPNPKVTEKEVQRWFGEIFQNCSLNHEPKRWQDLPLGWRDYQKRLLEEYDKTAPYVGPGANESGHGLPGPPQNLRLWPQNEQAIAHGEWPQWYVGSYPYCFQIPTGNSGLEMGQAPGTHWYHSHKHGSTSINLFNGLAGAFIITDTKSPEGYDRKLQAFYKDKLEEKVLVFQQITTVLKVKRAVPPEGTGPQVLVNGQLTPTITIRPGQVQLWRMINATVMAFIQPTFTPSGINYKQTAQDGVQFDWENYEQQPLLPLNMAPANRVDLLVQAPSTPGCYTLQSPPPGGGDPVPLLYVNVTGDAVNPAMGFPSQKDDYPMMPPFLSDIQPATIRHWRSITYGSRLGPADPNNPNARQLVQFTINGKQFEDQTVDESMLLGTAEEWTLYNTDVNAPALIPHPFHIHVNPFQVFEIYSPSTMTEPLKLPSPYAWYDTFQIPVPKVVTDPKTCAIPVVKVKQLVNGKETEVDVCPGYFKMRSRFVDFTGQYVEHCHILAHEDRGMMQLLQVISNKTTLKHH